MNDHLEFLAACEAIGCEVAAQVPLSEYTTFRIGGAAEFFACPASPEQIGALLRLCHSYQLPYYVLGKGSNLLVSDQGVRGVVISTQKLDRISLLPDHRIRCESGVPLVRVCRFALEQGLAGLEFAYGIPGTAGGAALMNAGAYGGEMRDVLISCDHVDADGSLGSFAGDALALRYRGSVYADSDRVITSITLQLQPGDPAAIRDRMEELMSRRREKQPLEYPSAGSTFKRPTGYYAGALIEQCGLKGCAVGGAQVSEKHAGFIINRGGATAADVRALIEHCRATVKNETGVLLEPEVKFIG